MRIKNLLAVVAVMFASVIQVGCGTAQQGNCAAGQIFQNGVCTTTGMQNGWTTNTGGSCTSGPSYMAGTYGCAVGYLQQGNQCVCNSAVATGTPTPTGTNGCTTGYSYLNYPQYGVQGCFQQGQCASGYAFHTPSGYCFRAQ